MANETHVVTGEARLSYVHLLKPYTKTGNANGTTNEPKFSVTVLVPKADVQTMQRISTAIEMAIQRGVAEKWNGARPPILSIPVYDGDGTRPSDGMPFGAECRGHWVFTASCKADRPPRVVDAQLVDIMDPRAIYSGIYGRVGVDFFPFLNNGKKGIGVGLTNVQKLRDGDALGSSTSAEEDFGGGAYQQPQGYQPPAYGQQQRPAAPQGFAAPQYQQPAYGQLQQPAYGQPQPQPPAYGQGQAGLVYDPLTGTYR